MICDSFAMNAVSGNLASKISNHLCQFFIADDLKINYKILTHHENDYSEFDERQFITQINQTR